MGRSLGRNQAQGGNPSSSGQLRVLIDIPANQSLLSPPLEGHVMCLLADWQTGLLHRTRLPMTHRAYSLLIQIAC
uniref:Uncharacterized protein n=1 Tax=Anguilla anguilla TaxID=7936 RepID=A0A0E9XZN0_ANGAN